MIIRNGLILFMVLAFGGCSEGEGDKKEKSASGTEPEDSVVVYSDPVEVYEQLITVKSASKHSEDFESLRFMLGVEDVWVELDGEVVDSGTYVITDDTLHLDLVSKSYPIQYAWQEDGEGEIEMQQIGTNHILTGELTKN